MTHALTQRCVKSVDRLRKKIFKRNVLSGLFLLVSNAIIVCPVIVSTAIIVSTVKPCGLVDTARPVSWTLLCSILSDTWGQGDHDSRKASRHATDAPAAAARLSESQNQSLLHLSYSYGVLLSEYTRVTRLASK
jgi:hypothetical protein